MLIVGQQATRRTAWKLSMNEKSRNETSHKWSVSILIDALHCHFSSTKSAKKTDQPLRRCFAIELWVELKQFSHFSNLSTQIFPPSKINDKLKGKFQRRNLAKRCKTPKWFGLETNSTISTIYGPEIENFQTAIIKKTPKTWNFFFLPLFVSADNERKEIGRNNKKIRFGCLWLLFRLIAKKNYSAITQCAHRKPILTQSMVRNKRFHVHWVCVCLYVRS